ncbi:hypothetical protein ACIO13_20330 [Streptomyces sp. NPDC087425]|uniref:hypothetical protein n=1 Tax=Streptomyces sp. NPDC087425 TaxID=3365787 RepID=UPI003814994C
MKQGTRLVSAAVLAGLALPVLIGPVSAQAAPGDGTQGAKAAPSSVGGHALSGGPSITATRSTGAQQAADVITCTPQVQRPHNSSHVRGTVNVVVTMKCTKPVARIAIRAALYRNGGLVKDSGTKTFTNSASAQNNAAVACSSATYQGWMSYVVNFPAGYTPPSRSGSGFGSAVNITC